MNTPMIGVYWGAFDPPTSAHYAIIRTSLNHIPLKKLFVIVNNHQYKKYTHSLETRLRMIERMLSSDDKKK